ncbi:hypothetical protein ADK17_04590 [Bacillus anthracis]|nr:hypothetical protein ADK17_04590 [Bacillus anthracis]
MALLKVKNLKTHFPIKGGIFSRTVEHVKAVDGVSFELLKKAKHTVSLGNLEAEKQQQEKQLCT